MNLRTSYLRITVLMRLNFIIATRVVCQCSPFSNSPTWNFQWNFPTNFWWNFSNWIIYGISLKSYILSKNRNWRYQNQPLTLQNKSVPLTPKTAIISLSAHNSQKLYILLTFSFFKLNVINQLKADILKIYSILSRWLLLCWELGRLEKAPQSKLPGLYQGVFFFDRFKSFQLYRKNLIYTWIKCYHILFITM